MKTPSSNESERPTDGGPRPPDLRLGTSGYQYDHWKGTFYPADLRKDDWLARYATRFSTVEINATFYGLPTESTVAAWRDAVPDGFLFALKFSRYGSHRKCLKDPEQTVPPFLDAARILGDKLGPLLVQLKPNWRRNVERLRHFLDALPGDFRWAFEFRDPSWFCDEVYSMLRDHRAALVVHDMIDRHPEVRTADWTYRRFHGDHYAGHYSPQFLTALARRLAQERGEARSAFVYFNNDADACAVEDAQNLQRYLQRRIQRAR
jgi:uncharacterized protein YecE (DUF72 family)